MTKPTLEERFLKARAELDKVIGQPTEVYMVAWTEYYDVLAEIKAQHPDKGHPHTFGLQNFKPTT